MFSNLEARRVLLLHSKRELEKKRNKEPFHGAISTLAEFAPEHEGRSADEERLSSLAHIRYSIQDSLRLDQRSHAAGCC